MQPYPSQDNTRQARIVADVCGLLHDDSEATQAKVGRWLFHVLNHCHGHKPWWFLQNMVNIALTSGQDVIDLLGHVSTVSAVFCGPRLNFVALSAVAERRSQSLNNGWPNGGVPKDYSLEGKLRLHLWPAPDRDLTLSLIYQRPMAVELVPDEWETLLLDGIIGLFGRHFDRDALTQEPHFFEQRFNRGLNLFGREHDDVVKSKRYDDSRWHGGAIDPVSEADSAVSVVMPASLTGIGHASIESGLYVLEVP